ncbi:CSC1-like protein 1 [Agrilus planipennis]|uniref:CSC1-like protein 1 n=1 Tax=Agrilus planipennis TaxID=224129 RepID=A0A1W4XJM8_AGRPL|nr:CSC1-like protein 1 [Agrilus planipennis]XP_018332983.1 CSC1-like protein 1 [Agrilus planipennis]
MNPYIIESDLQYEVVDNDTCLNRKHNSSIIITNVYEGIPETLIVNLISWASLILLFALLRNRAWDYGRLALVHNEKWTQLFYKSTDDAVSVDEATQESSLMSDSRCCSWFPSIFKINKHRLIDRAGPDAAHYLSFQQHLLLLKVIITILSLCVILPINFQGNLQGSVYTFGHTTLSNLEPTSNWLWMHVICSFALVPLTVLVMRQTSSRIPTTTILSSRTVMVTQISKGHRNPEEVRSYFLVRFPNIGIKDVQFAYRIKDLTNLEHQREAARQARIYCEMNNREIIKVQPYGCYFCCPCKSKNALEYYIEEESRLNALVSQKRHQALHQPLGIAFVTLETAEEAEAVLHTFVPGTRFHWNITNAPTPSDIIWENLQVSARNWYSKAIIINVILFLVLFFLTTPAYVVNLITTITQQRDLMKKVSPVISEFLPTLLMLFMAAIMPVIVAYSDQWMSHWTKSKQNLATMQKTFFFLLFMVLILPSLGLTSAQALVEWSVSENRTYRWECVFLPDKGAFFVNYVITSSLIGTALELLRFPELAMYVWRLLLAKSPAEKISIQKNILAEFPYGIHYAWTLLIFTTSTVYSLTCPLITPFGLLYLCLKHFVDKHNLFYVYRPSGMCGEGQQIHILAVKNVRVAVLLLQAIMATFAFIRGGLGALSIVTMLGFVSTCSFFFLLGPFPSCRPVATVINNMPEIQDNYVAPVLISSEKASKEETISFSPCYGSSNSNEIVPVAAINPTLTNVI